MAAGRAAAIVAKMGKPKMADPSYDEPAMDEDDAAGEESAMSDFIAAVKSGDAAAAIAAYKDLKAICG